MRDVSLVKWRFLTLGIAATLVAMAPERGRAADVRGQARAVQSTVATLGGSTSVTLADTGTLSDSSDAREASQNAGAISGVFQGEALHATTIGWPDQVASEASVAGVAVSVGGVAIAADLVMSRANAAAGAPAGGTSTIGGLTIAGVPVAATGAPNQTVAIPGGRVIINEQQATADGVTVNALHVIVDGVADLVVASATAALR